MPAKQGIAPRGVASASWAKLWYVIHQPCDSLRLASRQSIAIAHPPRILNRHVLRSLRLVPLLAPSISSNPLTALYPLHFTSLHAPLSPDACLSLRYRQPFLNRASRQTLPVHLRSAYSQPRPLVQNSSLLQQYSASELSLSTAVPMASISRKHAENTRRQKRRRGNLLRRVVLAFAQLPSATALHHMKQKAPELSKAVVRQNTPLIITNQCADTIYAAVNTQSGQGPSKTGFKLDAGGTLNQTVSEDWQGRVWGRTNCSFNAAGTGPANGGATACGTGDCNGKVACDVSVRVWTATSLDKADFVGTQSSHIG